MDGKVHKIYGTVVILYLPIFSQLCVVPEGSWAKERKLGNQPCTGIDKVSEASKPTLVH